MFASQTEVSFFLRRFANSSAYLLELKTMNVAPKHADKVAYGSLIFTPVLATLALQVLLK